MAEENPSAGGTHSTTSRPSGQGLDLLSPVWRFFAAPHVLVSLLGLVALSLMLGTLIPQIPPEATEDPVTWLAMQSGSWSQISGVVHTLGLHDLLHSLGFRVLLALTGLTLFVWLVDSAAFAWRAAGWNREERPSWSPETFGYWGRNALELSADSPEPPNSTESQTWESLVEQGFRVCRVSGQPLPNLVAHKRALALWAWPVFHAAVLAALVGLTVGAVWGWRTPDWQLEPGASQVVGHGTPYALRLDAFDLKQDGEGRLLDYRSHITWLEDGSEAGQGVAISDRPVMFGGLMVRQSGFAPLVDLRGRDSSGRPVALQLGGEEPDTSGEITVTFPTPSTQQLILVDDEQFVALSFEPLSAEGKPSLHLYLLGEDGAERLPLTVFHESGSVEVGDTQLELELAYRPLLRVERRPGPTLVVGGAALAVLALAAAWLASPQVVWIALGNREEGGTRVHVMALPPERGSRWPRQLTSYLQREFDDGA